MSNLLGSAKATIKAYREPLRTQPTRRFNFFPISLDPIVIFTYTGWDLGNVFHMARGLAGKEALFIIGFSRYPRKWQLRYMRRQISLLKRQHPATRIVFLANSEEELDNMQSLNLQAYQVSNNAFQREDQFQMDGDEIKCYDAVMNARLAPWKRLELAREVQNMALITIPDDEEYGRHVKGILNHASWINFDEQGEYRYLTRPEVSKVINRSKVGLILSGFEGNNRASIEYLMCGLPVVSTLSKGGRDVFFDDRYCMIVDADPDAVKHGVMEMMRRAIKPEEIRKETLGKIGEHRYRFAAMISDLTDNEVNIECDKWLDLYPDNMDFRCSPDHFIKFLNSNLLKTLPVVKSENQLKKTNPDLWDHIISSS